MIRGANPGNSERHIFDIHGILAELAAVWGCRPDRARVRTVVAVQKLPSQAPLSNSCWEAKGLSGLRSNARNPMCTSRYSRIRTHAFAAVATLGLALGLGGCSSVSGLVADHWPHWAGGMPDDVPPRPGAPGYDEFIAHGRPTANAPDAKAAAEPATKAAAAEAKAVPQPALQEPGDAVNGGLY